ncbi:putative 1,4-beta-D-xylan synthase [Helianthus annuus]|nr:putative 1,4-beta-D-xylan synthase [Helianthus annuus]
MIGPFSQSIGQGSISSLPKYEFKVSNADINSLPKYEFKMPNGDAEQPDVTACKMISMGTDGIDFSIERALEIEDAILSTFHALHMTGLMHTLMNLPYDVVWIVVEADEATNETAALLAKSKVKVKVMHIGFEKKMPIFWEGRHKVESEMRLKALRVVREEKLDGIVMFADDSNMHSLEFFDEIQNVEWIGAISVGILAQSSHSDEDLFEVHGKKTVDEDEKKLPLAVRSDL